MAAEKQKSEVGSLLVALRRREEGLREEVVVPTITSKARMAAKRVRSMVLPARSGFDIKAMSIELSSGGSSNGPGANLLSTEVRSWTSEDPLLAGALFSNLKDTDAEIKAARNLASN